MAKGISTGIEHLVHREKVHAKITEQLTKQWKDIRTRIDQILLSNNIMKSTDVRQRCLALDSMTNEERTEYIKVNWGPLYLQKTLPLLQQLATLESQLIKAG